ncbi:uncharacterized protein PITG_15691 [Phytophthora infestans T30-4]|uniref:Uncharacterized protein n=1 Tax=Phytophthora infestans (strain T30-4) TaxID=403677 RepID=D0NSC3_PHYIT|nr:uncharacterized protein PITG_15691 [Phytophthora infestans T30-4]EEY64468.1 hypothetical protein PITG_15691 [Phytophthora infestans T30-4]|eukprot:XP_002897971.1 hypothetical protein PITG_15691 [Phytophthora infestans T30-4]
MFVGVGGGDADATTARADDDDGRDSAGSTDGREEGNGEAGRHSVSAVSGVDEEWDSARGELQVKNGSYSHSHGVSVSAYATYFTSWGIADPLVGAHVDGILHVPVGAKRSCIYD